MASLLRAAGVGVLNLAWRAGAFRLASTFLGGRGVIFSLHRVAERGRRILYPGYWIHEDALDELVSTVVELGWECIPIDEVPSRLAAEPHRRARRFACFTLDDGYVDALSLALPVFRKHSVPFSVFAAIDIVERRIFYWWGACEEIFLNGADSVEFPGMEGVAPESMPARTQVEKVLSFRRLRVLYQNAGDRVFPAFREMFRKQGVDPEAILDRDTLTLPQLRELAADPLVTIGSHCVTHGRLAAMSSEAVLREFVDSRATLQNWLQAPIQTLAYPYGREDSCGPREFQLAREAGYTTAVTTRQGNIFSAHRDYLTALPRRSVPLNPLNSRTVLYGVQILVARERRFRTN